MSSPWIDPRIVSVKAAEVRSYLLARGWKLVPFPGPELWVFEGPRDDDDQPIIQVVPSSEQLRDFRLRVEELIGALSILEDRPAGDVLNDILLADLAKAAVPATGRDGDTGAVASK